MSKPKRQERCPARARHWRIALGTVGLRTPVCVYCGSPNPKPLKDWEWDELIDWHENSRRQGLWVSAAIEGRLAGQHVAGGAR